MIEHLPFFREFLKVYVHYESINDRIDLDQIEFRKIGHIIAKTPETELSFPLVLLEDDDSGYSAAMIQTTDNEFMIGFTMSYFMLTQSKELYTAFLATCAHEVGHYLAKHFHCNECSLYLDIKPDLQAYYLKQYEETGLEKYEQAYMRTTLFSLVKGGTVMGEVEADLKALMFVPLSDLILTHTLSFQTAQNPFVKLEKMNRIRYLTTLGKDHTVNRTGYRLEFMVNELSLEKFLPL